jgi:hypothetical protein
MRTSVPNQISRARTQQMVVAGKSRVKSKQTESVVEDKAEDKENGTGKNNDATGGAAVSALSLLQKRMEREGDGGEGGSVDEHMTFDLGR